MLDTLVIGGGQAGLAVAYYLNRAGVTPTLVEAGSEPVGSWPRYYHSLTLFSPAKHSQLPGLPFDGDPHRYPARDEVVDYLRRYAARLDADIHTDTRIHALTWHDGVFVATTTIGGQFTARRVISATGSFAQPHRPHLPGLETFDGTVLHSADYRRPDLFAGQRVLIVGAGNSAVQIAVELAQHTEVTLTSRHPVRWVNQRPAGRDIHDWLAWTRLQHHPVSRLLRHQGVGVLDDGTYQRAIRNAKPAWRQMFDHIDGAKVTWNDGSAEPFDAILLATGFRPGTDHLHTLTGPGGQPALADDATPAHRHGVSTTIPGLGFVGLEWQRGLASATLRGVGPDAALVTARVQRRGPDTP